MNQEKVGKLIAKLRKEKDLTQDELGEKLGITGKSVSKWERGLNAPDISILKKLSNILNISVMELLDGELSEDNEYSKSLPKSRDKKNKIDNTIIKGIDMYQKNFDKKNKKIIYTIIIIFIILSIFVTSLFGVTNYNNIKMFTINNTSDDLSIQGHLIFNPQQKYIIINKITYNDEYEGTNKAKQAKALKITLVANEKNILEYGNLDKNNYDLKDLNSYLSAISIDISENINDEHYKIKDEDLNNIKLIVEYIDENNQLQTLNYELEAEKEFENNKIIY